jgi:hypothetical protein
MHAMPIAVTATAVNLCLVIVGLTGFPFSRTREDAPLLRGRALELVDDRGQIRARLDVEPVARSCSGCSTVGAPSGSNWEPVRMAPGCFSITMRPNPACTCSPAGAGAA